MAAPPAAEARSPPGKPGPRVTTVKVRLGGPLMSMAGGRSEFEIEAATIREMLARLGEAYPELKPLLARGVTVAVNGEVFHGAFLTPIPEGSEVFLLPAMQGG